jgi:hypothetical protein
VQRRAPRTHPRTPMSRTWVDCHGRTAMVR